MPVSTFSLKTLQAVFFAAMREGWPSGSYGVSTQRLKGWSQTRYKDGDLLVVDRWGKDPMSRRPSGSTLITYHSIPLWVMWYGGYSYSSDATAFLRDALMQSYNAELFTGGRGPVEYRNARFCYVNKAKGSFAQFRGQEHILQLRGGEVDHVGAHRYWGGSLLFLA